VSQLNDKAFVRDVLTRLQDAGIRAWLFGGWAEELLGIVPARKHQDLDLLYPAADFGQADRFMAADSQVTEITAKRFAHKRAFLQDGIMIELILVQTACSGEYYTLFWNDTPHCWPADVFGTEADGLRIASAAALREYRACHARLAWTPAR
jgi:hypothetical protein